MDINVHFMKTKDQYINKHAQNGNQKTHKCYITSVYRHIYDCVLLLDTTTASINLMKVQNAFLTRWVYVPVKKFFSVTRFGYTMNILSYMTQQ